MEKADARKLFFKKFIKFVVIWTIVFVLVWKYAEMEFDSTFAGIFVFIIFLGLGWAALKVSSKKSWIEFEERYKIAEEKKAKEKQDTYDNACKEIYEYYEDNHYDITDKKTNDIIATTKNIIFEDIVEMYNHGKEIIEQEIIAEEIAAKEEKLAEEISKYEKAKESASLLHKDKYLYALKDKLEAFEAMAKLSDIMQSGYISGAVQAKKPRKSDPYILGGMANGIAGPGAGLMVASSVAKENARREAEGRKESEASINEAIKWSKIKDRYNTPLEELRAAKELIENALIDKDSEAAKKLIKITNKRCKLLETGNFKVTFTVKAELANILGKEAIVDGVIKINVLDEENNIVAEGYYTGKNVSVSESNYISMLFGFRETDSAKVYCKALDYTKIDINKKYKVEAEITDAWIMEDIY